MLLSPEMSSSSVPLSLQQQGPRERPVRSEVVRPSGVGEHVQTEIEAPQELGRTCQLHGRNPGWGNRVTNPRPVADTRLRDGSERGVFPWYRQAKETKCGGKGDRRRSALIVPMSSGNLTRKDPGDGKRVRQVTTPLAGNTAEASTSRTVST